MFGAGRVSFNRVLILWILCFFLDREEELLRNFVDFIFIVHHFQNSLYENLYSLEIFTYFSLKRHLKDDLFKFCLVSVSQFLVPWEECMNGNSLLSHLWTLGAPESV